MHEPEFLPGGALPDAPLLARRGPHAVGVTTREFTLDDVPDLSMEPPGRGPRTLTAEIWYPAAGSPEERCTYGDRLGRDPGDPDRPDTAFRFAGRAARDARPERRRGSLVLVSHGYPGSRVLLSYLCEHLASCGRVVMALDHPGSVHGRLGPFSETLLHRSTDIIGGLEAAAELDRHDSLLGGHIDAESAVLIGYSMGGYGVLNVAGMGYSRRFVEHPRAVPGGLLAPRGMEAEDYRADPRVRAVVAFAPWGGQHGVWDEAGMAGLAVPTLFVAGSDDDVVGWDPGVRSLFAGATGCERALLVHQLARHNIAPNPAPPAALTHPADFAHYAEPLWDTRRLDNINQHFVRAFLERHLDGIESPALDLIPLAADGGYEMLTDGDPVAGPDHWWGFPPRTAIGLEFHRLGPGS